MNVEEPKVEAPVAEAPVVEGVAEAPAVERAAGVPADGAKARVAGEALQKVGRGLAWTGSLLGRAAARAGRSIADAYLAIDPDVRKHAAQLPLIGLTQLGGRLDTPAALPDDGHRPVIFVHGLQGHRNNFLAMQAFFRFAGRRRSYAITLRQGTPLQKLAEDLARFIDEVIAVNRLPDHARVDIVAHSMGGIVSRLAVVDPRTAGRVATLVTLGTPHAGTHVARYASTTQTLELRPGSATLAALQGQLPWRGPPEQPRLVALWSKSDMVLLPAETGSVEGAENVEAEGFTHFAYLIHPEGWTKALAALERAG